MRLDPYGGQKPTQMSSRGGAPHAFSTFEIAAPRLLSGLPTVPVTLVMTVQPVQVNPDALPSLLLPVQIVGSAKPALDAPAPVNELINEFPEEPTNRCGQSIAICVGVGFGGPKIGKVAGKPKFAGISFSSSVVASTDKNACTFASANPGPPLALFAVTHSASAPSLPPIAPFVVSPLNNVIDVGAAAPPPSVVLFSSPPPPNPNANRSSSALATSSGVHP